MTRSSYSFFEILMSRMLTLSFAVGMVYMAISYVTA